MSVRIDIPLLFVNNSFAPNAFDNEQTYLYYSNPIFLWGFQVLNLRSADAGSQLASRKARDGVV